MKRKNLYITTIIASFILSINNVSAKFDSNVKVEACGFSKMPMNLPQFTSGLFNIIRIAVPILLIIMAIVDLLNAIMSSDDDGFNKSKKKIITRVLAAIVVFFVMTITKVVFDKIDSNDSGGISNCMNCILNGNCLVSSYTDSSNSNEDTNTSTNIDNSEIKEGTLSDVITEMSKFTINVLSDNMDVICGKLGFTWNEAEKKCYDTDGNDISKNTPNKPNSTCTLNNDKKFCKKVDNCVWENRKNKCFYKKQCNELTYEEACREANCSWDGKVCSSVSIIDIIKEKFGDSISNRTPVESSNTHSTSSNSKGKQLVEYAKKFVGNSYKTGGSWNGETPYVPTDCSGFTKGIYKHFGYDLPRTADDQSKMTIGKQVPIDENSLQPGDLLFFYNTDREKIGHVVIYAGDHKVVHAAGDKEGVKIGNYYTKNLRKAIRIFN